MSEFGDVLTDLKIKVPQQAKIATLSSYINLNVLVIQ